MRPVNPQRTGAIKNEPWAQPLAHVSFPVSIHWLELYIVLVKYRNGQGHPLISPSRRWQSARSGGQPRPGEDTKSPWARRQTRPGVALLPQGENWNHTINP